jgi:tetratricopeptide (TPR) repeat protein
MRKLRAASYLYGILLLLNLALLCSAQQNEFDKEFNKGVDDYSHQKYKDAEKHLRAAIKAQPDSWQAHLYLADVLFAGARPECIQEYEKAQQLTEAATGVELAKKRHINDQLGVLYGMGGDLKKSIDTYQKAIAKDPDFPPYYYNLACSYSESGDLDQAIANLREAYKRKDTWPYGRGFPDPRKDSSFKKYIGNEKFEKTMKEIGF